MLTRVKNDTTYIVTQLRATTVLLKWLRRGEIKKVNGYARTILFSSCKTDADRALASAIPFATELDQQVDYIVFE